MGNINDTGGIMKTWKIEEKFNKLVHKQQKKIKKLRKNGDISVEAHRAADQVIDDIRYEMSIIFGGIPAKNNSKVK